MSGLPTARLAGPLAQLVLTDSGQVVFDFCEENTLTQRLAVNQHTTLPWSFEQDLFEYEAAGIGAIGLVKSKIEQCGRFEALEAFHESRLRASSLDWIAGFTGHNGYSLNEVIEEGIDTLQLASDFGASTVVVIAGPRNGHTWNHADKIVLSALGELGDCAEGLGVSLALLPMSDAYRDEWSYFRSFSDALSIVRRVNRDHIGLAVHTGHVFREQGLPRLLHDAAPWTKLVRLSDCALTSEDDNDQRWLGQGIVPVTAIAAALDDAGYRGYYETDVWSRDLWTEKDFRPMLKSLRDLTFGSPPPPVPTSSPTA